MKIDLGLQTDSALKYIKIEGLQAYTNRKRDHSEEVKRLRKVKQIEPDGGRLSIGIDPPPVLNVSSFPPAPNRSGAVAHLLDRLKTEQLHRQVALAYPRDGSWWLEMWFDNQYGIYSLGSKANLVELLTHAARLVATDIIHLETLLGLPVNLPHGLEKAGLHTILSIHDFALFCRRPHLIDTITGRFCEYCLDTDRCRVCLKDMDPEERYPQADYRKISAASIYSATAVLFPSAFIQRKYQEFFPSRRESQKEVVIAPAMHRSDIFVDRSTLKPNIAFVGGIVPHKGGRLIPPVMGRIRSHIKKAVGFVYGSGDIDLIEQIKLAKGIKIRGYYRHGALAAQLAQDKIAVAVMPSITPEAYSTVIDECLATGTPVVAFDHGAVADRLEFWSVGELVPPERGAVGLAEAALDTLSGRKVGTDVMRTLPQIERSIHKYADLYKAVRARSRQNGDE